MVRVPREIVSFVFSLAASQLTALGFRKRAGGGIFTRELAEASLGLLGLNDATNRGDGKLEIFPVVGVRHQELERLVAQIKGKKYHSYFPATISTHLGYVMPENTYVPWLFAEGEDNEAIVRQMVEAVREHGCGFMDESASLEAITRKLEQGIGIRFQLAYRRPVAYWLLGRRADAEAAVEAERTWLGDPPDYAERCLEFFAGTSPPDPAQGL